MVNDFYQSLTQQAVALTESESDLTANLANISALLNMSLDDINWVGFYLLKTKEDGKHEQLVLGPFQGKPACIRIDIGKGGCGSAVAEDKTLRVDDVHAFAGHIACDAQSNAEIVIPIHANGRCIGVLDIDSPSLSRFSQQDEEGLNFLVKALENQVWLTNEKDFR